MCTARFERMSGLAIDNESADKAHTGKQDVLAREKKSNWFVVNPYIIAGVFGFSLAFSWFFGILTISDFVLYRTAGKMDSEFFHIVFAAILTVSYLVIWRASDWFQSHRAVLLGIALVCGSSVLWGMNVFPNNLLWAFVKTAFTGMGVASLFILWSEFISAVIGQKARVALATSIALSFVWYLLLWITKLAIVPYALATFGVLSAFIYLFLKLNFSQMDNLPEIPAVESDLRLRITWEPWLLAFIASVAQGFAMYWLLSVDAFQMLATLIIGVVSLIVFTIITVDTLKQFLFKESFIRRLFLPILGACILSLFFLPEDFWIWPCAAAFVFSLLPYSSSIFATCEHVARCHLSAIRVFGYGRAAAASGLLTGSILGWLAFSSNIFGTATLSFWVVIVVMIFIIVSATVKADSYYPGDESPEETRSGVLRIGINGEIVSDFESPRNGETGKKYFQMKCDAVSEQYGLSKRQTEVLHLLAKGRNADYIQKQLFISQHTAKAHIYNIYQKTGSHSRQDLMDLVENTVVDKGEDKSVHSHTV